MRRLSFRRCAIVIVASGSTLHASLAPASFDEVMETDQVTNLELYDLKTPTTLLDILSSQSCNDSAPAEVFFKVSLSHALLTVIRTTTSQAPGRLVDDAECARRKKRNVFHDLFLRVLPSRDRSSLLGMRGTLSTCTLYSAWYEMVDYGSFLEVLCLKSLDDVSTNTFKRCTLYCCVR